jgi:hypothetical protein
MNPSYRIVAVSALVSATHQPEEPTVSVTVVFPLEPETVAVSQKAMLDKPTMCAAMQTLAK